MARQIAYLRNSWFVMFVFPRISDPPLVVSPSKATRRPALEPGPNRGSAYMYEREVLDT